MVIESRKLFQTRGLYPRGTSFNALKEFLLISILSNQSIIRINNCL